MKKQERALREANRALGDRPRDERFDGASLSLVPDAEQGPSLRDRVLSVALPLITIAVLVGGFAWLVR